jgi:hypothetical protein
MIDGYTLPLALRKTPMGLRVRWALEATFVYLAQQQKAVESKEFLTILSEILAYWRIPQEYAEKFMKLTKQPPRKDFDPLTAYGKLLVPGIEFGPDTQPSATKRIDVEFTNSGVIVDGDNWGKDAPLLLVEFVILKRKKIHWLWAYIILPEFNVTDPDYQFRNYISKKRKDLANRGIHVATFKRKDEDGVAVFEGMDDQVVSNIRDIWTKYEDALSLYNNGNVKKAVEALSYITNDIRNQWYTFTDAYMDLARWICELNFKDVSEETRRKCRGFFEWYLKRLRLGISKIERYAQRKGLSTEASNELQNIKTESEKASRLYSALVERTPFDPEDQAYEEFVAFLLRARENLELITIESEAEETKENTIVEAVKLLAEQNKHLAQIIEYGSDVLDELLEERHQRENYIEEQIQDMREDICWRVGQLILGIDNFDEFGRRAANKLQGLKDYLCSRLRKQLERYV